MRDIPGYDGLYAVDENGSVWSYRKNDWLKPLPNGTGYFYVILCKDKKRKIHSMHRLVAKTFLENYSEDLQVDHIDCNRQNNKLENLRMVTQNQNQWNRKNAKGFYWNKTSEKWMAYIKLNNKMKNLGYFNSEAEAREAYLKAKQIYHII